VGYLDYNKALKECSIVPNDSGIGGEICERGGGRECRVAGTEEGIEGFVEEHFPELAYFSLKLLGIFVHHATVFCKCN
jgi:hypothetical protein